MKMFGTRLAQAVYAALVLLAAGLSPAWAYADRPVKLIVPFAPGGANDIVARLLQAPLEKALQQPVIVENRPGASGILGTDFVAKSPPDGYTLGVALATHSVNPAINDKMPYDTEKDLAPVILVGKNPMLFLLNPKVPANDMASFVRLVRSLPGQFSYATPGAASQAHLIVSQWSREAGADVQHIPYRGGAPATLATIGGETQFTVMSSLVAGPQVEAGKLRAVAIGSLARNPNFPNVPTLAELGYKDIEAVTWVGLFAPAGTPPDIVARLNAEVDRIIHEPDIAAKLKAQGIVPDGGPPDVLAKLVTGEIRRWMAVVRQNHIPVQR